MKKLLAMALCLLCFGTMGCTQVNGETNHTNGTKTEEKAVNPVTQELIKKIDTVINNNAYFELYDGPESYLMYFYNTHGEAFAQSSNEEAYSTITRNNGTSVNFTHGVSVGTDIDVLNLLKRAVTLVDTGYATLETADDSIEGIGEVDKYHIKVKGFEDLKQLYIDKGEEYANSMIENMKNTLRNDPTIVDIDNVIDKFETEFVITTNDGGGFGADCLVRIGDSQFTSWTMFGYLSLYDWQLPEEWYTYDFKDLEVSENMLNELVRQIDSMMGRWADDMDAKTGNNTKVQ